MDFHLLKKKKRGRGRETAKLNNSLTVKEKSDPPLGKQLTFSILSDTHPTHPLALLRTGTLNHIISKKQGLLLSYNTNYSSCIFLLLLFHSRVFSLFFVTRTVNKHFFKIKVVFSVYSCFTIYY